MIRRTRAFIRTAYPEATINGKLVRFPQRRLKTINYDLEATYEGIYDRIVAGIEDLTLAPYNLETYLKSSEKKNEFEAGREEALVGIFKTLYLKRFESSIASFRISIRRALSYMKTFKDFLEEGRLVRSGEYQKAQRYLEREWEDDDATPVSSAEAIDTSRDASDALSEGVPVDASRYDLGKIRQAVEKDIGTLSSMWESAQKIGPKQDAKLVRLKQVLCKDLRGKKVIVFTSFMDTARYLYDHLGNPEHKDSADFRRELEGVRIRRMDSGADPKEREGIIAAFAPKANGREDLAGTNGEIDILISTDVLSEGQNLQDCGHLVNYDLHWNPTRLVQRAGRIDRLGTTFDTLMVCNMFPEEGLEKLIRLVERLTEKIQNIDRLGFLDASILGESVHPRNFNTLKRIKAEDGTVVQEEEQLSQLASSEFMLQQLRAFLDTDGREAAEDLPDGIHSGLVKPGAKGVFFYLRAGKDTAQRRDFWRYVDLKDGKITDNRYLITSLIACQKDTARVVEPATFARAFELQEKAISDILGAQEQQRAVASAPRTLDPVQQEAAALLQSHMNNPAVERIRAIAAIKYVNDPMLKVQLEILKTALKQLGKASDAVKLIEAVEGLRARFGEKTTRPDSQVRALSRITREDLRLICFDFLTS